MATDFNYGNKTVNANGPVKPSGKDMPGDPRTRADTFADIVNIPVPYVGMIVTVLQDETNSGKMTDYKVKSLKANSLGSANSVIDEVVRYVDYLGAGSVSQNDINTAVNNYLTEHPVQSGATVEQAAQIQANTNAIGNENSGLVKDINDVKARINYNCTLKEYNNRDEMINDATLKEGDVCRTLGFYTPFDGGGAEYIIRSKESYINDEVFDIILNNGTIAQRALADNKVNVLSLGIKKNSNKSDDIIYASNKLKKMFETYDKIYTAYFPSGDYYIHSINLDDDKHSSGRKISLEGEKTSDSNATWNVFIYTRGNNFLTTTNSEQDYITVKYISFHGDNLAPDGTTLTKKGKCFSSEFANEFNFNLTGVRFANFEYGWYCTKYACTGSYAKDLTLYANKYGIYIPMATHGLKIEGVHCHYNMTALYLPTGGTENIIKGFNYSPGYLSVDKDDYNEYIGIYTQGSLTIDGMYLEDYLGAMVSPEKSIAIDYKCSENSTLRINSGIFSNYAAATGEKVIRYRGNYGSNNLILTNPIMDKNSIDMFAFESGKVVTGIVIDGKESVIYSNKMYINNFPPEKHFIASKIRTSQIMNIEYNSTTYQCYEIPMCNGDLRNKSIIIGAENLQDDGKYLPTVGNWLSVFPSYMKIKGYFKISGYNFDGKMKLFMGKPTGTDGFKCIEFTVNNGEAIIPIDETIDYYKFEENTSNNFIVTFYMGTTIGDNNTLSFSSFTNGTSYDIEFITPDDKHYQ